MMTGWVLPALGVILAWGLWGFLPKLTTQYLSPRSVMVYEVFGAVFVALLVLASMQFRLEASWRGATLAVMAGAMGIVGALCYVLAMVRGPVALIVTFTALYPILSIGLAWLILGETISIRQGIGIVLGLVAMVLIST